MIFARELLYPTPVSPWLKVLIGAVVGLVAAGCAVAPTLVTEHPGIQLLVAAFAGFAGVSGGVAAALVQSWFTRSRTYILAGGWWRSALSILASSVGFGIAYVVFFGGQSVWSPLVVIGVPASTLGLILWIIERDGLPRSDRSAAVEDFTSTRSRATSHALLVSVGLVATGVQYFAALWLVPGQVLQSSIFSILGVLEPAHQSLIVGPTAFVALVAVSFVVVAIRARASFVPGPTVPTVALVSLVYGAITIHTWWYQASVAAVLRIVEPGVDVNAYGWPMLALGVSGWFALGGFAVITVVNLRPRYLPSPA